MDRCLGTSSALLLFHLALNLLPWLVEFNYTSYLPDYLYPHAEFQWKPEQWNYLYLNSSEILGSISEPH